MKKRWKLNPANREIQDVLVKGLGILPLTAQLLINRGLVDCDRAFSFLNPLLKDLHDPFLLKDMDRAVARIVSALYEGEPIAIYGDYDVDGTTSTALLYLFFRDIGVPVTWHIPDRLGEGYGLNVEAVRMLAEAGTRVVITVDCGSSNHEEIKLAGSLGMDVIVTDHHELPGGAPQAAAVVNPKQTGCAFPFKGLAGIGVAFNLVVALRSRLRETGWFKGAEPNLRKYLDLVSLATVADMVPLVDENRVFVHYGLKELVRTERPGLVALKEAVGLRPGRLDAYNIAFQLAPRINAAGRIAKASVALRLLITEDPAEAARLAGEVDRENRARQKLEEGILNEALAMLCERGALENRGIVLYSEKWHPGVIGIVASRLVERYGKPTAMIALDSALGKGSARGVKSFDILEGIKCCSGLLLKYGGHRAAAGFTLERDKVERFAEEFLSTLDAKVTEEDLVPEIVLDAAVALNDIDLRFITEAEGLAPFGVANREPLLCLEDAHITETAVIKDRHLRLMIAQNGCERKAIGFGLARLHPLKGEGYNVAFTPYMDEWRGVKNPGIKIKDVQARTVNSLT